MEKVRLGFIGAGNMAGAIMSGITGSKLMVPGEIGVFDIAPDKLEHYRERGFQVFGGIAELAEASDAVFAAVKPQNFPQMLPELKEGMSPDKLLISIAAGVTADAIRQGVGFDCRLVLAMPNTPLLLGCGATAISAVPPATDEDVAFARGLFESAGMVAQIAPALMNEVIPVNGSSPAFFYYLAKLLADHAVQSGISPEAAYPLVGQAMLGSARMLLESDKSPQELIDMVCSPGGTTAAAMKALDDNGFCGAVEAAFSACVKRARELSEISAPSVPDRARADETPAVKRPDRPWYEESVFYQIYPMGFCGAPEQNDGNPQSRIMKVLDWIPHMLDTGVDAIYFSPVFESDSHGYDTRDYSRIDCRLGSNQDFARVCAKLHSKGFKIVLDGVFNHVGRGFWAFQDVRKNRQHSQYKDWFFIDFNRDNGCNDGFWYEGWEGHYELVKLNLDNPRVREHLFHCIGGWIEQFGIDGLRLDVAYMLSEDFMRALRGFVKSLHPDFFLVGEAIHGDYTRIVNPSMLDSCTNYECYKGIYSSFNDRNMFEIAYSLNNRFGPEPWVAYRGLSLFNFVDNHDVTRIASQIRDSGNLMPVYGLLFGMPGMPCVYYGSEWGEKAEKTPGSDAPLRPCFDLPREDALTEWIAELSRIRRRNPALMHGGYKQLYVTNLQLVFVREWEDSRVMVAINADSRVHTVTLPPVADRLIDLIRGGDAAFSGTLELLPNSTGLYRY